MENDRVAEVDPISGRQIWESASPDGAHLRWLNAYGDVAYLIGALDEPRSGSKTRTAPLDKAPDDAPAAPTIVVRRLGLGVGDWLAPMTATADELGGTLVDMLVDRRGIAVLGSSTQFDLKEGAAGATLKRYYVAFFRDRGLKPSWSKAFGLSPVKDRRWKGPVLLSCPGPDYATSDIRPLSWLGDDILVCNEESHELFCFHAADGKLTWQLPRIWELERWHWPTSLSPLRARIVARRRRQNAACRRPPPR